jgi:hypothetical protein
MRFQIPSQDAMRIRSAGPRSGGGAEGGAAAAAEAGEGQEGIDERAIQVDFLASSGGLAHQQLSERLRSSLAPSIPIRESAAAAAAAAAAGRPRSNESSLHGQRMGQAIGRVDDDVQVAL